MATGIWLENQDIFGGLHPDPVRVSNEKGGIGFLFWNARNDYAKPFGAMPVMEASKSKYFHSAKPVDVSTKQAQGGQ